MARRFLIAAAFLFCALYSSPSQGSDCCWEWPFIAPPIVNGDVRALFVDSNRVAYVGGDFTIIDGVSAGHFAMADGASGPWRAVGPGFDGRVNAIVRLGDSLYAAGACAFFSTIRTAQIEPS